MTLEISKLLIGFGGVLLGAIITYYGTRHTAAINLQIAKEKLNNENKLSISASKAIELFLREPEWELRSFDSIKKHIRGFKDDELRHMLVASGAVSFEQEGTGKELWGLLDRNYPKLKPAGRPFAFVPVLAAPHAGPRMPEAPMVGPALAPKAP